jgi:phosphatidylethanolamine-binding protein (PEBP) family uncharacterized protein
MLQYVPRVLGRALKNRRAGTERLAVRATGIAAGSSLVIESSAFQDGGKIPLRYTADGEGLSPALRWRGAPPDTRCVALLVEDADSPTSRPLVHAIVPVLPSDGELSEGSLRSASGRRHVPMARNSYLTRSYLPPDPPPGHGPHRYAFQVFALRDPPPIAASMGRSALLDWMKGRLTAKGLLTGVYERK